MKEKIRYLYLTIFFISVLLLPVVFFEHQEDAVSFVQAKTLAAKPSFFMEGKRNENFISELQQYVEERIGFRDDAIAAVLVLKYKLFRILDVPDFFLGSNGNIYYSTNFDQIDVYTGKNKYTMEELAEMAQCLTGMDEALSKVGTDLYCAYIPNKEGVYWEDFKSDIAIHADKSRMDDFYDFLVTNTEICAVNLKSELSGSKNEEMLYYRVYDGSHWNQNGAFRGTQAILRRMQENDPEIENLSRNDYKKIETDFCGCMERYINVPLVHNGFRFRDTLVSYEPVNGWSSDVYHNNIIAKGETHFHNDCAASRKSVLILGDSYMASFCLNYFAEQFQDVYFMSYGAAPTDVLELCKKTSCDIALFEVVERCFSKELYTYTIAEYGQY